MKMKYKLMKNRSNNLDDIQSISHMIYHIHQGTTDCKVVMQHQAPRADLIFIDLLSLQPMEKIRIEISNQQNKNLKTNFENKKENSSVNIAKENFQKVIISIYTRKACI